MNCPNCKNPIQDNSTECEWCGCDINSTIPINNFESKYIVNFFLLKIPYGGRKNIIVFIDGVMVKEFFFNDGCDFDVILYNTKPKIEISLNDGRKMYKLPEFIFEIRNKYRFHWSIKWGLVRFDKPAIYKIT